MIIKDARWPPKRNPSLRGSLMIDTVNGQVRVRAWPKKRPQPPTAAQAPVRVKFAQSQYAWNYMADNQQRWIMEQRANTPLLPRDVVTAMMFNQLANFQLPDGRMLYPMPARTEVSFALDAITQTEGAFLRRGGNGWEEWLQPNPNSWTVVHDAAIANPTAQIVVQNLGSYSEIDVLFTAVTVAASGNRSLQLSQTNGASFINAAGNYNEFSGAGILATNFFIPGLTTASSAARYGRFTIFNPPSPGRVRVEIPNTNFTSYLALNANPIDAFRFYSGGGNLTGGRLTVLAK